MFPAPSAEVYLLSMHADVTPFKALEVGPC